MTNKCDVRETIAACVAAIRKIKAGNLKKKKTKVGGVGKKKKTRSKTRSKKKTKSV